MEIQEKILETIDWTAVQTGLDARGFALVPGLLSSMQCAEMIDLYSRDSLYYKTINMQRYRFGAGEYRYFRYPLPPLIQQLRESVYTQIAPVANRWMRVLNSTEHFPETLVGLQQYCRQHEQTLPTVLILRYGKGGHNTLHQDLYGDIFFPLQAVLFLSQPGEDYTGGEFVLTQQVPRAQSKAIVLRPQRGDMLLFTTRYRPEVGSRGYYRVQVKHGVSEVTSGTRYTLGIIFHDARA